MRKVSVKIGLLSPTGNKHIMGILSPPFRATWHIDERCNMPQAKKYKWTAAEMGSWRRPFNAWSWNESQNEISHTLVTCNSFTPNIRSVGPRAGGVLCQKHLKRRAAHKTWADISRSDEMRNITRFPASFATNQNASRASNQDDSEPFGYHSRKFGPGSRECDTDYQTIHARQHATKVSLKVRLFCFHGYFKSGGSKTYTR